MTASFRLMTANLLHDRCDASDFARLLEDMEPDILVCQELGPFCADVVASAYPHQRLRPALGFTGRGIATRFEASFGEIDMPGRPGTSALLDVDGARVRLAGVHLLNPIAFPWWESVRARSRQLDGLFDWLGEDTTGPVLVAGDFNASPIWPAYRQVVSRLDDLVADHAERQGDRARPTWGWRPGWPKMLRIDHVFGTGIEATAVQVEPIVGTDHAAVVVDLELVEH